VTKALDPKLTRRWIAPALADRGVRLDTAKFLRGVDPVELLEVSTRLQRFTKPVVLLWGDADRFFPVDLGYRLCETFPDAQLVEIPGGRAFFPLDEPEVVANEIQSALKPRP
jgi:pimeloyl-ACP methyl ester carboxylesterase